MFEAIAFLVIAFIYMPIHILYKLFTGGYPVSQDEIRKHNVEVKRNDKLDNDYGYIVRKDKQK